MMENLFGCAFIFDSCNGKKSRMVDCFHQSAVPYSNPRANLRKSALGGLRARLDLLGRLELGDDFAGV